MKIKKINNLCIYTLQVSVFSSLSPCSSAANFFSSSAASGCKFPFIVPVGGHSRFSQLNIIWALIDVSAGATFLLVSGADGPPFSEFVWKYAGVEDIR